MGSTRIRALTGRRRPCGGLRAIPMSRSGRATSCQPPLRRPESERPGRLGAISLSVGRDVVIYRKSLTLQLHCLARHTPICQGSYSRAALPSEPGTYLGRIRRSLLSTAMAWCGITWPCYLPCLCPGSGPCGGNAGIGDYPGYATYSVLPLDRRQCRDRELTMQGTKNDESRLYRREAEPLSLPET
jgi:hypothetical protein